MEYKNMNIFKPNNYKAKANNYNNYNNNIQNSFKKMNFNNKNNINKDIKIRSFDCGLCYSTEHGTCKCPRYYYFKKDLSKYSYYNFDVTRLKEKDERGFCASGIIPYVCVRTKVYMLVLVESRQTIGLNFIGGKRECLKFNNKTRPETSYETAINELEEELTEILTPETKSEIVNQITKTKPKFCFWASGSKMSLYGVKIPEKFLNQLILNDMDKTKTEAMGFMWIEFDGREYSPNKLFSIGKTKICEYNLHSYTKNILDDMKMLSKNNNLYNLFL